MAYNFDAARAACVSLLELIADVQGIESKGKPPADAVQRIRATYHRPEDRSIAESEIAGLTQRLDARLPELCNTLTSAVAAAEAAVDPVKSLLSQVHVARGYLVEHSGISSPSYAELIVMIGQMHLLRFQEEEHWAESVEEQLRNVRCDALDAGLEQEVRAAEAHERAGVRWSPILSPKQIEVAFGYSWRTVQRWMNDGRIRHEELSSKAYKIAVDDIPPGWQLRLEGGAK